VSEVNFEQHYKAFKWAISKNWKDKNRRYYSIQSKIRTLTEEFHLSEVDILDDIFSAYWERGHYKRYNPLRPGKASLQNWVSKYVIWYLNNLIRKCAVRSRDKPNGRIDPLERQNWANIVWADRGNTREDPDFQPEVLICSLDPERILIALETCEQLKGHFDEIEFDYVMQGIGLAQAAIESGCTPSAFQKRIERKRKEFIDRYM
jgi:hypothetical protein